MNNMIKIFKNEEFGSLRILKDDNGRIMFCGKDVASALGYSNTKDAIKRHCRWGVKHDLPHPQSPSKTIKMIFIPEGDDLLHTASCRELRNLSRGFLIKFCLRSIKQAATSATRKCS